MKVDFHLHTFYSDGKLNYEDIFNLIKINNLKHFSITDHDIYDSKLNAFFSFKEITPFKGMEISTKDYSNNRKVHFLTYNFNSESKILNEYIAYFKDIRNKSSLHTLKELKSNGYKIDEEPLKERINKGLAIYKQHIMFALFKSGYTKKIFDDLYDKLKKEGMFPSIKYISYEEGLSLINDINGIKILAHPGFYENWNILDDLIEKGLDGIEAFHSKHKEEDTKMALNIADKNNLLVTGGSDFHGWLDKDRLGLEIKEEILNPFIKVLKND